jgi:hypothetical protein
VNRLIFCALACLLLLSSQAQATPWYRIELMLVAYLDQASQDSEQWPVAIDGPIPMALPDDPANVNWWLNADGGDQPNQALLSRFGVLPVPEAKWPPALTESTVYELDDPAARIRWRKDMQLVYHKAWIEPVQEQGSAIQHPLSIRVDGDLSMDIRGTVSIYLSRYLHFTTDLVVQHYKQRQDLLGRTQVLASQLSKDLTAERYQRSLASQQPELMPLRAAHVRQARRMRSGEWHYIDHPMLGAIIKIIPINDAKDLDGEPVS